MIRCDQLVNSITINNLNNVKHGEQICNSATLVSSANEWSKHLPGECSSGKVRRVLQQSLEEWD
jgi:hypothetical protein